MLQPAFFFPAMDGFDRHEIDVNGIRTVVYGIGQGRPIVFLHGAGTFPGFEFARRLAANRRVLIPYHPGFGESADDDGATTIDDYVLHYATLFEQLGLCDIDLAGFSLGGWIAAEYAARFDGKIRRLVLVAPAGLVVAEHPVPVLSVVAPQDLPGYLTHDPTVAVSYFPKVPDPAFDQALGREMMGLGRLLAQDPQGNPKLERWLPRISAPTLLLWGSADRMRPAGAADAWLKLISNSSAEFFPETGHLLFEERPEAADSLLAFFNADIISRDQKGQTMVSMPAGVTKSTESYEGIVWSILGQTYTLKQHSDASMAWHAVLPPGTFVPPHIHPTQDEFIYLLEGELDLLLDGEKVSAKPGDTIRLPMGQSHGIFNNSADATVKCVFWVAPTGKLRGLFERIHNVGDPAEVVRIAAEHDVDFLPPPDA